MTLQWHICASPEYLKRHGVPQRAEDLDAHKLILFGSHHPPVDDVNWLAEMVGGARGDWEAGADQRVPGATLRAQSRA